MTVAVAGEAVRAQTGRASVRVPELDGIRGWAAFSVLLYHVLWEVLGNIVPLFRNPVTAGLLNGEFDVAVFFALSGEALSASFLAGGRNATIVRMLVKRYIRLTVPITVSSLITVVLLLCGAVFSHQAAPIAGSQAWLGRFLVFQPSLRSFVTYVLADVYGPTDATPYNAFLWTMRPELLGSLGVFMLLFIKSSVRYFEVGLIAAALVMLAEDSVMACFPIGVLFASLRIKGVFAWLQDLPWAPQISGAGLLGVIGAVGYMQVHRHWGPVPSSTLGAAFLFLAFCNRRACGFFGQTAVSRFLGHISFPLYLVHFAVLVSFTSWAVVAAHDAGMLSQTMAVGIALGSVVLSVAAAVAFLPVERLTLYAGDRWARFILR